MVLSLAHLNEVQRAAVSYQGDKHCLIFAGAGSGKTRVLTHRIAWLIQVCGLSPASILAITFTNRAAGEMRERTIDLLGGEERAAGLQLSTFHAFGCRFLRRFAPYVGLNAQFTIYAESEQRALVKTLLTSQQPSDDAFGDEGLQAKVKDYTYAIASYKESALTPELLLSRARSSGEEYEAKLFERYERGLRANNAVDFADLLGLPLEILRREDSIRDKMHRQYRHILVDEFQDCNATQLALLDSLCGPETRLTVVGDDDQSIYAWRGADATGILKFQERFGASDCFKLEQNYRSTEAILAAASSLIEHNALRNEKTLWTAVKGGELVQILPVASDSEEAKIVVMRMIEARRKEDKAWQDFAILFRKNSQSIGFERACTMQAVPYQVIGGLSFFEREEIADLMAYLRILVNPVDKMAFRRIINKPARGIGEKTAERICELIEAKGKFGLAPADCLSSVLRDIANKRLSIPRAGAKAIQGCHAFLKLLEKHQDWASSEPRAILDSLIQEMGFIEELRKTVAKKGQDFDDALERIDMLKRTMDEYQREHPNDLPGFLEDMVLVRPEDDSKDAVKLMTIHSAKGLEFDSVFVTGLEAKLLPLERGGICELEEERRLMYVAMTRAKRRLCISYALKRYEFGFVSEREPSLFLEEILKNAGDFVDAQPLPSDAFAAIKPKGAQLHWSQSKRSSGKVAMPWRQPQSEESFFSGADKVQLSSSSQERHKASGSYAFFDESDLYSEGLKKRRKEITSPASADFFGEVSYQEPCLDALADVETELEAERPSLAQALPALSSNGELIQLGDWVRHKVHGVGKVLRLESSGRDVKVVVEFRTSGERSIIARFLERI